MVIVEGMDGTGKTTLVRDIINLIVRRGFYPAGVQPTVLKYKGPPRDEDHSKALCLDAIQSAHHPFIHERFAPISEACYGGLNVDWYCVDVLTVIGILNKLNPLIIYCRNFDPTMKNHVPAAHENPQQLQRVKENYVKIQKRYDLVMGATVAPVISYDFETDSTPDKLDSIATEVIKKLQAR